MKKCLKNIFNKTIFSFLPTKKLLKKLALYVIKLENGTIDYYDMPEDIRIIQLIKKIKNEVVFLLSDNEAYQLYMNVKRAKKINGEMAEIGVYKGGSAKLICEAKGKRNLFLFDTFAGLPEVTRHDNGSLCELYQGQFSAPYDKVKNYLKKYQNVFLCKGVFPLTAQSIRNKKFCFVHLDVDTYKSTKDCLEFFYNKMSRGGVIISHDYSTLPGVKKAFDEFFEDKSEVILKLAGSQCLIIKL